MSNHIDPKMQEIRDRHAAATPGPWDFEILNDMADIYPSKGKYVPICQTWTKSEEPMENSANNALFIAHAPEDIAYLLSEYKRLQTAATNAIEVLEQIKRREIDAYKYETDVYLDAVSALSHLKGE